MIVVPGAPTSVDHSPLSVLLSMQKLQEVRLTQTATNLSNASTTGYKSMFVVADEFDVPTPQGLVSYPIPSYNARNTRDGGIKMTGNTLDVALTGKGYFQVMTAQGIQYTRNGQFVLNAQGQLVTASGDQVLSNGGSAISIGNGTTSIKIYADGTIKTNQGIIGQIGVVSFPDDQQMTPQGNDYYATSQDAQPSTGYLVTQGAIELSNVDTIGETVRLIEISRLYEQSMKIAELINNQQTETINVEW